MFSPGNRLRGAIASISVALIMLANVAAYRTVLQLINAHDLVDHTQSVIEQIDRLFSTLRDAEIRARDYVITAERGDLDAYRAAVAVIPEQLLQLDSSVADNLNQHQRLHALQPLITDRLRVLAGIVEERSAAETSVALSTDWLRQSAAPMERIGMLVAAMVDEENRLYRARRQTAEANANQILVLIICVTAASVLAIGAIIYWMSLEVRRRRLAETQLRDANAGLEQRVRARTDELSRSRDALQRSSELLAATLEAAPFAIVSLDPEQRVLLWNRGAEHIFGYTAAETVGRPYDLVPADERARFHDLFARVVAGESLRDARVRRRRKDGALRDISAYSAPLFEEGRLKAIIFAMEDMTERDAAETRQQELQSELLHVSRLSAMGQMGSALAHEINQPLAAIANYVKAGSRMLSSGDPVAAAKVPGILDRAVEQAARAGQIIRRLRDFVGKGETHRDSELLDSVIREAAALVMAGMPREEIEAQFDFDPRAASAVVDRVQIQQVLVNLMRNALEAMAESAHRRLAVSTAWHGEDQIAIRVADTGPGLAKEVSEQLFKPFVTTKAAGMGVGLSICHTIVEAHGGTIWAEPNPGGGTIFAFTVPAGMGKAALASN